MKRQGKRTVIQREKMKTGVCGENQGVLRRRMNKHGCIFIQNGKATTYQHFPQGFPQKKGQKALKITVFQNNGCGKQKLSTACQAAEKSKAGRKKKFDVVNRNVTEDERKEAKGRAEGGAKGREREERALPEGADGGATPKRDYPGATFTNGQIRSIINKWLSAISKEERI